VHDGFAVQHNSQRDRLGNGGKRRRGIVNLDNKPRIAIIFQIDGDGLVRVMDIPEDAIVLMMEGTCTEHSGHMRETPVDEALQPGVRLLLLLTGTYNMGQRDFQVALERPEPIGTGDVDDECLRCYLYMCHLRDCFLSLCTD